MNSNEALKFLKIIVFDLDGTLLNDDGKIGEETIILIDQLHKYDVKFSFATGRLHSAITDYAKQLKINTPLISLDGTLIKNFPDGDAVFQYFINPKYIKKALDLSEKLLINIALCHGDAIYYTENNDIIPQLMEKFGAKYEEVSSYNNYIDNTLEVVFASDNKDSLSYAKNRFEFPHSTGLNTSFFQSQRHEGIYYLEVRKKGATKGKGLMRLLKHLNIRSFEAAVIGDWYNDVSLFKTPVFKVAVANAVPELKRMSNVITEKTNNEDGVAEFLEMVLKAKRES